MYRYRYRPIFASLLLRSLLNSHSIENNKDLLINSAHQIRSGHHKHTSICIAHQHSVCVPHPYDPFTYIINVHKVLCSSASSISPLLCLCLLIACEIVVHQSGSQRVSSLSNMHRRAWTIFGHRRRWRCDSYSTLYHSLCSVRPATNCDSELHELVCRT